MKSPSVRGGLLATIVAGLLAAFAPANAAAATGAASDGKGSELRLLSPVNAVGDLKSVPAGLDVVLDPGWKTYWRSPGDAGMPPEMDWSSSVNVAAVTVRWPVPHRFSTFGVETFGYKDEVVFPLDVRPEKIGEPVSLRGSIELLVCSDVCVPASHQVSLDLPAGPASPDPAAVNRLARFDAAVPVVEQASVDVEAKILTLRATSNVAAWTAPDVFVEVAAWTFGRPEVSLRNGGREAVLSLPVLAGPDPVGLLGKPVTVTVTDAGRAAQIDAVVSGAASDGDRGAGGLAPILAVALLGGMVLNLMPCVLPVLSLKLMSVIKQQGQARRRIRIGFLMTSAGAITAMLVLAGALVASKAAGGVIGWGMQFQQPIFIAAMVLLLTSFAGSMAGAFEFRLPSALSTRLGTIGGDGAFGHFATGAFATILATHCSAPFLGTAVGFALARGPLEIMAVFGALGVGLAAPYLLIAAFPAAVGLLPRPGRWMGVVRFGLAAALAGTALWLLSVLAVQTSPGLATAIGLSSLLALAAVTALVRGGRRLRALAVPTAIAAVAATFALPTVLKGPAFALAAPPSSMGAIEWRRFDQADIGRLVAQGQTVFVDVTADWCVTCIVNKKMVVERTPVADALKSNDVVAVQADMTLPDEAIARYLAQHDRYGIPFNIVYGPGAPRGIQLPEVLTEASVMGALRKARADRASEPSAAPPATAN